MFPYPIAFNLIPQNRSHKQDGFTSEEMKMVKETHKIMGDDSIAINATCIRVPVMIGHSESIYCETAEPLSLERIRELFASAPGVTLLMTCKASSIRCRAIVLTSPMYSWPSSQGLDQSAWHQLLVR